MSNGGTNGFATALALAMGSTVAGAADGGDQAEMFQADLEAPAMLPPARAVSGPKGGRPAGVRNKSTEAVRTLFLSRFRHPMMALGELTSRTPEDLARELKLYLYHEGKPVLQVRRGPEGQVLRDDAGEPLVEHALATGEAFKAQREALIALLPYLGQKLPMAIEVEAPQRGVVVIGELDIEGAGDDLDLPLPPEENQRVIDIDPQKSDDDKVGQAANANVRNGLGENAD